MIGLRQLDSAAGEALFPLGLVLPQERVTVYSKHNPNIRQSLDALVDTGACRSSIPLWLKTAFYGREFATRWGKPSLADRNAEVPLRAIVPVDIQVKGLGSVRRSMFGPCPELQCL